MKSFSEQIEAVRVRRQNAMLKDRERGHTLGQIAAKHGVSKQRVHQILAAKETK